MRLILVDRDSKLTAAWKTYFADLPQVEIVNDSFTNVPAYDCLVSPANSFGIMDGGIDAAITRFFGQQLMDRVQEHILNEYHGEQPVGTSFIIETHHEKHSYLAHTPTMRTPMLIYRTDVVYIAMWTMLNTVAQFNRTAAKPIERLLCPGLGTGTGGIPALEGARQMALAYGNFLTPPKSIDWDYALKRQQEIRFGGYDGFTTKMEDEREA
jgi:O-acetyl-ADP-ribose deacetylase (regulator of RNase III)